MILIDYLIAV